MSTSKCGTSVIEVIVIVACLIDDTIVSTFVTKLLMSSVMLHRAAVIHIASGIVVHVTVDD